MPTTNPVIVVHGIQGSWLKDEYPVDYQDSILWTGITKKNFAALPLHVGDPSVDADAKRLIQPHQAVSLIYESLVDEIRDEFQDTHPYVYMFTYDWRKDNRAAAEALGRFVDRVLNIAGVHERSAKPPKRAPKKVSLVGHSMGGLVIKWYVTKVLGPARAVRQIDKIITLATPYRGSLKAVEALLPGARNLFGIENQKSMRHASRTLPGVYQLLPSWPEAVVRKSDGKQLDLFETGTWQRSLTSRLTELYGPRFFKDMLEDALSFATEAGKPWPKALRNKAYAAYGHQSATWWQVPVDTSNDNFFQFDEVRMNDPAAPHGGDGTVHTTSSFREELSVKHLKPDTSELKDIFAGHHANMPNHSSIQDWVLSILGLNENIDAAFESPG